MRARMVLGVAMLIACTQATTATAGPLGWSQARATTAWDDAVSWAEEAIIAGGVLIHRHRHALSGAALGCAAGAALAATATVSAGVVSSGATLAVTPQAMSLGCGLGALGGAALGSPLDGGPSAFQ